MPLSAQEFLLPGIGGNPGDALNALGQKLYTRNMQTERLNLAKEGRREQAGNFLKDYLNPKDYLTGSPYDPVISQNLQAVLAKGAQLAEQGADIPQLLMAIGPDMDQINQYSAKVKAVKGQIGDTLKRMKDSGLKGYDYGRWEDAAMRQAFHKTDPNTGRDLGLNDIKDVDPSQNYAMKILQDHPDQVTTDEGFDQFVKETPKVKTSADKTTFTPKGTMSREKINITGEKWLTPEYDETGVIKGLVPNYEHATEGGTPIVHEFTDANGKVTPAPVRLLDEGTFNDLTKHPGVGDFLRGEISKHIQEYKDRTGEVIKMDSPQAHNVARAVAYDMLNRKNSGGIGQSEVDNKPSGAEVSRAVFGDTYSRAYDKAYATAQAKHDAGDDGLTPEKAVKPLNAIDVTHQIFNNNPDYLNGDAVKTKDGHRAIDVTPSYSGGLFRFGHGQPETYAKVMYDPVRRVLITKEVNDEETEHPESEMKAFLKKIAGANRVNVGSVEGSLSKNGYQNGRYVKAGKNEGIVKRVNDQMDESDNKDIQTGIDDLATNGKGGGLKDTDTPEGKIVEAGTTGWLSSGKYYLDLKQPDGSVKTKKFKDKGEMEDFLKIKKAAPEQPTVPTPTPSKSKKNKAILD